jgi:hypothetical protein
MYGTQVPGQTSEQAFDLRKEAGHPNLWIKPVAEWRLRA